MKRISSWNSSKFITASSFLISIPGIYSYFTFNLIYSPLLLFTTSIISANYWRDAIDGWRRKTDLIFAKLSFSYFVYQTYICIPQHINYIVSYPFFMWNALLL